MANIPVGTPPVAGGTWKGWASSLRLWLTARFAAVNRNISDMDERLTLAGINRLLGNGLVTLKDFAESSGGEIGYANNTLSIDLADGTTFFAPAGVRGNLTGGIEVANSANGKHFTLLIHTADAGDITITRTGNWLYRDGNNTLKANTFNIVRGFVLNGQTYASISQYS